ncbi:MAG: LysR substrate-binding domain-containing protein [Atopobiaceae bacterium]
MAGCSSWSGKNSRRSLQSLENAQRNMAAFMQGKRGTLRVGFMKNMDPHLLVGLFGGFVRANPHVILEPVSATSRDLCQMAADGKLDALVGMTTSQNAQMRRALLDSYPLVERLMDYTLTRQDHTAT